MACLSMIGRLQAASVFCYSVLWSEEVDFQSEMTGPMCFKLDYLMYSGRLLSWGGGAGFHNLAQRPQAKVCMITSVAEGGGRSHTCPKVEGPGVHAYQLAERVLLRGRVVSNQPKTFPAYQARGGGVVRRGRSQTCQRSRSLGVCLLGQQKGFRREGCFPDQ